MRENFDRCMEHVFASEGGYVDHKHDPGGATNMGITHKTLASWRGRPVSKQDVRDLTKSEAKAIYRANYWNPVKGDSLPAGLDLVAFDGAVNSGVSRGSKWLQRALEVSQDGRIGPETLRAAIAADPVNTINRACMHRLDFLRGLSTWAHFGRGWERRVIGVRETALSMAEKPAPEAAAPGILSRLLAILVNLFGGRNA